MLRTTYYCCTNTLPGMDLYYYSSYRITLGDKITPPLRGEF